MSWGSVVGLRERFSIFNSRTTFITHALDLDWSKAWVYLEEVDVINIDCLNESHIKQATIYHQARFKHIICKCKICIFVIQ